jgi:hypothetical protein
MHRGHQAVQIRDQMDRGRAESGLQDDAAIHRSLLYHQVECFGSMGARHSIRHPLLFGEAM